MRNTITQRQKKEKELIIENLKKIPIIEIACNKSGVARATFYRWKKQFPDFSKSADDAIREGVSFINDMAESQLLSAIKDGNISAIFYWLNHRHVAYGNKVEISTLSKTTEKLSKEQEEIVKKALALTGFTKKEEEK